MRLLTDKTVRKQVASALMEMRKIWSSSPDVQPLTVEGLEQIGSLIFLRRRESSELARLKFGKEMSIGLLSALTFGCVSIAIDKHYTHRALLPRNWISPTKKPDPNRVIHHLLVQVANHSLAIIGLIELGLDSSARVVLRALQELCWLTVLVASDRDKMIAYCQATGHGRARKVWSESFSSGKLRDGLLSLERRLRFPFPAKMRRYRRNLYAFYSQSVHSSVGASTVGSYAVESPSDRRHRSSLFGATGEISRSTLVQLNWLLFQTMTHLIHIFGSFPDYKLPKGDSVWRLALCLIRCLPAVLR